MEFSPPQLALDATKQTEEKKVLKWLGRGLLAVAIVHAAWVEWSVLVHAGILWGLFFAAFFISFALSASLAVFPIRRAGE